MECEVSLTVLVPIFSPLRLAMRFQLHVVSAKRLPLATVGSAKGSQEQIPFYSTIAICNHQILKNKDQAHADRRRRNRRLKRRIDYFKDAPKSTCTERREPLPLRAREHSFWPELCQRRGRRHRWHLMALAQIEKAKVARDNAALCGVRHGSLTFFLQLVTAQDRFGIIEHKLRV